MDLRDDNVNASHQYVTTEHGKRVAELIKADAYFECSARTGSGVPEVFLHVFETVMAYTGLPKENRSCIIA